MEKQVLFAMNGITGNQQPPSALPSQFDSQIKSPQQPTIQSRTFNTATSDNYSYSQSDISDTYQSERMLMQIDHNTDMDYKKIETKDTLWKPAPIMGREIQQPAPTFTYAQPQITSNFRTTQQQQNFVLPSHFNRGFNDQTNFINRSDQQSLMNVDQIEPMRLDANTEERTISNTELITNSSSLPDFVSSSLPQVTGSSQLTEGKTIYANSGATLKQTSAKSGVAASSQNKRSTLGSTTAANKKGK